MVRNASRLLAWFLLILVVLATWSPIGLRPHLSGDPDLERALALGLVGMAFGCGYPRWILPVGAALLLGVASLEWSQNLVAGRHGRLDDAVVKSAAAVVGLWLGWLVARRIRSHAQSLHRR